MARVGKSDPVHLDTHIVCWLYEGRSEFLTPAALRTIESGLLHRKRLAAYDATLVSKDRLIRKHCDKSIW